MKTFTAPENSGAVIFYAENALNIGMNERCPWTGKSAMEQGMAGLAGNGWKGAESDRIGKKLLKKRWTFWRECARMYLVEVGISQSPPILLKLRLLPHNFILGGKIHYGNQWSGKV